MLQDKDTYHTITSEGTDEELMDQYQTSGHFKTFELIYTRHFTPLCKYLFWLLGDMESSKDIAQNIFVKILDKPNLFDTTRNFKIWIYSIAKNNWKNDLRNKSVKLKVEKNLALIYSIRNENSLDKENEHRLSAINKAIDQLSENHREVIVLKYTNNFTIDEIAQILECSEGTVKSRLFYAIKNLKKHTAS